MAIPKLLTKKEVMEALRISKTTLESRVKAGEIPMMKDGSKIWFKEDDIVKYLARKTLKVG